MTNLESSVIAYCGCNIAANRTHRKTAQQACIQANLLGPHHIDDSCASAPKSVSVTYFVEVA